MPASRTPVRRSLPRLADSEADGDGRVVDGVSGADGAAAGTRVYAAPPHRPSRAFSLFASAAPDSATPRLTR